MFLILIVHMYKKAFAGTYLYYDFFIELREGGAKYTEGGRKRARPPLLCHCEEP